MNQIEWREISDWPGYSVSTDGRVRNAAGRELRLKRVSTGYQQSALYRPGLKRYISVHRLVAAAFIGPIPPTMQVNHKNGCKHDNRLSNLEIVTPSGNAIHAVALGLRKSPRGIARPAHSGETHCRAKLSSADVTAIREAAASGPVNKAELARRYGVSDVLVGLVIRGRAWVHHATSAPAKPRSTPDP